MDKSKIAIALRFFARNPDNLVNDIRRLDVFLDEAAQYLKVYVAMTGAVDMTLFLKHMKEWHPTATALEASHEHVFVTPMYALVYRAVLEESAVLLSASAEFPPKREYVDALLAHLDDDTLVVGARFAEHVFNEGIHELTCVSSPWNTFSVWNLKKLARFGFPLIGDVAFDTTQAGVEEVSAIAFYQELAYTNVGKKFDAHAKLVTVPGIFDGTRNTDGWGQSRLDAHEKKIASKTSRSQEQLKWTGLNQPFVTHIA